MRLADVKEFLATVQPLGVRVDSIAMRKLTAEQAATADGLSLLEYRDALAEAGLRLRLSSRLPFGEARLFDEQAELPFGSEDVDA